VTYRTVVLRHYAFADRWFKINVTTDLSGNLVETGDASLRFAVNWGIATPMERDGANIVGVGVFLDVRSGRRVVVRRP
jgi:hypothetical protein